MENEQPKIVPPKTSIQNALDILAFIGLVAFVLFFLLQWPGLPERIPQHFNGAGEIDDYGSKNTLLLLPLIAIGIYFLFIYLNKRPYTFNYLTKITPENAEHQYRTAMNMMSSLNAGIILLFFFISWRIVAIVKGEATGLGAWFLPVFLGVVFLPIIIYFVQSGRKA